jgi:hypothetical protein
MDCSMNDLTMKVLARYRNDNDEVAPEQTQSWMDYMEEKAEPPASETFVDMLEHSTEGDPETSQIDPYDYEDPSEKPKDPKGPPFENKITPDIDIAYFDRPRIFKDHGELEEWLQAQGQDLTTVEEDQNPAMSLTCKYASVQNVVARYLMDVIPIEVPESELGDLFMTSRVAASLNEVWRHDQHYMKSRKIERAGSVSATWANENVVAERDKGLFKFTCSSPGSDDGPHTVFMQFLRGEETVQYQSYADYPVQMACTCPSFLYHGAQYYAWLEGYLYWPAFRMNAKAPLPQDRYVVHPDKRYPRGKRHPGRGLNFRVCKHILKVYDSLTKMRIEKVYRNYPISSPPSTIMNKDEWKKLMKFYFTEANIKQRLKAQPPKVPAYFLSEDVTPSVIKWFREVWMPRTDDEKIKVLKDVLYPERIFFFLIKEAYLKFNQKRGETVSDRLINEAYEIMAKAVQPESEESPTQVEMPGVPEEEKTPGRGTAPLSPANDGPREPAMDFIKKVEPATEEVPSPLAPTTLRKVKTPEERREERKKKLEEEQKKLRERGLPGRARSVIKRFREEEQEPRKEKLRQLGKRPFFASLDMGV